MHKLEKLILETYAQLTELDPDEQPGTVKFKDLSPAMQKSLIARYGEPKWPQYDFLSSDMETYFKTNLVNKETGNIGHAVIKLPSFSSIYKNFSDIIKDIKKLMSSADIRKDEPAKEFFELTKSNFRKLQRYLRTERPEQYRLLKMQRLMEGIQKAFSKIEEGINDHYGKINEFVGKELEDRNELLYDKLVPGQGDAETVEGEMLRAINRIIYRYYNDGDEYFTGYGIETAGPAHSFLVNANHPQRAAMKKIFGDGTDYEQTIKDALDTILDYIESRQGKYTKNTLGGIFDYEPEFEDDEEDYDDYDDYDDDEYYQEGKKRLAESLLDEVEDEEPTPEEPGDKKAPKETVLEDATDTILSKFPTLKAAIIKLQTEDFKEFVDKIDWISPRPTEFRINLKNGQDYILKWTGTGFEAQIMGKRYYIDKIDDYQQALDKLAILYKEGPMTGAGEGEPADVDTGGSAGGGGGDFPGDDAAGGGGEEGGDIEDLGGEEGGADLGGEVIDFEEPGEEPEA